MIRSQIFSVKCSLSARTAFRPPAVVLYGRQNAVIVSRLEFITKRHGHKAQSGCATCAGLRSLPTVPTQDKLTRNRILLQ
jgi:hypothetical protein